MKKLMNTHHVNGILHSPSVSFGIHFEVFKHIFRCRIMETSLSPMKHKSQTVTQVISKTLSRCN